MKAGLDNNEFCLWITSHSLEIEGAKKALRMAVPDIDLYLEKGQVEITSYTNWYKEDGIFDSDKVLNWLAEKVNQALSSGYDGLRFSGDAFSIEKEDWSDFIGYEKKFDSFIKKNPMIALCTYSLQMCSSIDIIEIAANHNFALGKKKGKWERIASSGQKTITKLKRTEKALEEEHGRLRATIDAMPMAIWIADAEGRIIETNEQAKMIWRTPIHQPESMAGYDEYVGWWPDTGKKLRAEDWAMSRALTKGEVIVGEEIDIKRFDGSFGTVLNNAAPIRDAEGHIIGGVVVEQDITEIKKTEKGLRESEERLRFALETSHTGAWDLDLVDHTAHRSLEHDRIFGYEQLLPQWTYEMFLDHVLPEDRAMVDAKFCKATTEHSDWSFECRIRRVDNAVRWIWAAGRHRVDATGNVRRMAGIVQDITERKRAEEALKEAHETLEEKVKERTVELEKAYNSLKESEKGLAEAQKMAHIGNWDWNLVTGEVYWSEEMYRIFGRNPQESGATFNEFLVFVHPDDRDNVDNAVKKAFNEEPIAGDYRIILANGEERSVHTQAEVIFDEKNTPVRMRGTVQDITERRQAEKAMQESEAQFRNLFEVISSGVAIYNVIGDGSDFIFKDMNPAGERIDHVRREDIIGKSLYELFPNVGGMGLDAAFRRVWHTGRPEFFPLTIYKDERIALWLTNYIYRLPSGELVAVFDDITERKKAEEALTKIETARKQEIHHRIKNNLQVISSLLDLQAEQFKNKECIKDSEVLEAFRESQDRVISMALIHEELYKGGGFETLNFSSYLEELSENLFQTYSVGNTDISLNMDLEENLFFDMDTAVPLGMIVNELVSNSLKHAFPGRGKGKILIKLCREENEDCINVGEENKNKDCKSTAFVMTVSDNGVGIPENFDIEVLDSLGFQLVTSLVDQLDGEFELKRNNGTEFTIRFIVIEKDNQVSAPDLH